MSRNRFLGLSARALMMIAAGLLVASYLCVVISPAKAWFLVLLGLAFVPLLLLNLFLFVWAIFRRSKAVLIPLIALLPALLFIGRYVQLGKDSGDPSKDHEVTLMTYNVGRFCPNVRRGIDSREACLDSVAAYVRSVSPEIVCLQEFYVSKSSTVRAELDAKFPEYESVFYTYNSARGKFGNVILTKLPIKDKGAVRFDSSANLGLWADIQFEDGVKRIFNCHLESYNISLAGIVKSLRGNYREVLTDTGMKMKSSIIRRPEQVGRIMEGIAASPVESIVCGDLNDSPISYTYYKMSRGRRDSFREAGHGFAATYSALWPLLRIDYVFLPEDMEALFHTTPHVRYSDHYPVIVNLK